MSPMVCFVVSELHTTKKILNTKKVDFLVLKNENYNILIVEFRQIKYFILL